MKRLADLIESQEDWLISRLSKYAIERGYSKYTSTLEEAWRASIRGLTAPLLASLRSATELIELGPDDDYAQDPVSTFGILEAQKHRARGITLGMFLGLLKYYRQSYIDLVCESGFEPEDEKIYRLYIDRFFDRVELGFCTEWGQTPAITLLTELQTANRTLSNEKDKYLTIFESVPNPVLILNEHNVLENLNHAAAVSFLGEHTPGATYYAQTADSLPAMLSAELAELTTQEHVGDESFEKEFNTTKGRRRFEIQIKRMLDISEKFRGTIVVLNDVTDRQQADAGLRADLRIQRSAMNAAGDQIMITNPTGCIEFVNPAFEHDTGYSQEEVIGKNPKFLNSGKQNEKFYSQLWKSILAGNTWNGELTNRRKNGTFYSEAMTITPIRNDSGDIEHFIAIKHNTTHKKVCEEQLDYLAYHDPLTNLPNRLLFSDCLTQRLAEADAGKETLAVMFLDLDRFKIINDTLGHNVGDLLLTSVAQRLGLSLRNSDILARMGGDEFTLILSDVESANEAGVIAMRILQSLSEPFAIDDRELFISASIGISVFPTDGADVETLVKNADTAMYRAKEQGRSNYQFYTESLNAAAVKQMTLEHSLRKALERNEFVLHYQPQVDIKTGAILGVEALVRWQHPEYGLIPPGKFIPLAEETGLIVPLGKWVISTACAQTKKWQDGGFTPMSIAINVSARQFQQKDLIRSVALILKETGLHPRFLEIELTESSLMHNPELAIQILNKLKQVNVRISIDDFGTGYSSLSYLKRFPIDVVKIDQSFIRDITTNPDDAAIAGAIVAMAHSLKLKVIAEGVETLEQLEFLRSLRCDEVQGYFISRPVPAEELTRLLVDSYNRMLPAA